MKGIVLRAEEVRALLAGATQIRRVIKLLPYWKAHGLTHDDLEQSGFWNCWNGTGHQWQYGDDVLKPNIQVGQRLYCQEEWWHHKSEFIEQAGFVGGTITLLDNGGSGFNRNDEFDPSNYPHVWTKRPASQLPSWASRITLSIVGVRAERLASVSEADAIASGVTESADPAQWSHRGPMPRWSMTGETDPERCLGTARAAYGNFWEKHEGKRPEHSWAANPFTWVYGIEKVTD